MAAQLTPKKLSGLLVQGDAEVSIPIGVLTLVCVVAVVLGVLSLIIGAWDAKRDEEAAAQRYTDAQALLALPPVDVTGLETSRDEANAALAEAAAQLAPPSVDPSSDAATTLLVTLATSAGLTVRGVASVPDGEVKSETTTYDVAGLRMTVEGNVGQINKFLADLGRDEPGLIPNLAAMTTDDRGLSRAEITFSVYSAVPTPTAVPPVVAQ